MKRTGHCSLVEKISQPASCLHMTHLLFHPALLSSFQQLFTETLWCVPKCYAGQWIRNVVPVLMNLECNRKATGNFQWSKGWCWWERDHAAKKASCIRRFPHPISMVNTKETRRETERKVVHRNFKGQELTEITQVCHILVGSLQCGPSACLPLLMALCGFPLD